jgi:hypothetical protein
MRLASMAAPTATPSTWPVMRIWATVAEALPSLGLATEPSTELLLGLVKSPRPKPTRASLQMIAQSPAWASSCVRKSRPVPMIRRPEEARNLLPIRSEREPLRGAMTRVVKDKGVRSRPA